MVLKCRGENISDLRKLLYNRVKLESPDESGATHTERSTHRLGCQRALAAARVFPEWLWV